MCKKTFRAAASIIFFVGNLSYLISSFLLAILTLHAKLTGRHEATKRRPKVQDFNDSFSIFYPGAKGWNVLFHLLPLQRSHHPAPHRAQVWNDNLSHKTCLIASLPHCLIALLPHCLIGSCTSPPGRDSRPTWSRCCSASQSRPLRRSSTRCLHSSGFAPPSLSSAWSRCCFWKYQYQYLNQHQYLPPLPGPGGLEPALHGRDGLVRARRLLPLLPLGQEDSKSWSGCHTYGVTSNGKDFYQI